MGANQSNERYGSEKSTSRGSVNNANRLEAFERGVDKGDADWGGCNPDLIQAVVVGITAMGGAVTFNLSRDQGAHGLTLLLGANRKTMWYNGDAELNECLQSVIHTLAQMD